MRASLVFASCLFVSLTDSVRAFQILKGAVPTRVAVLTSTSSSAKPAFAPLSMVATNVVNGEAKPRKTREVSSNDSDLNFSVTE